MADSCDSTRSFKSPHYDSKTNRCYIEIRVTPFDGQFSERHLFDGQRGEKLAYHGSGPKGSTPVGTVSGNAKTEGADAFRIIEDRMAGSGK